MAVDEKRVGDELLDEDVREVRPRQLRFQEGRLHDPRDRRSRTVGSLPTQSRCLLVSHLTPLCSLFFSKKVALGFILRYCLMAFRPLGRLKLLGMKGKPEVDRVSL